MRFHRNHFCATSITLNTQVPITQIAIFAPMLNEGWIKVYTTNLAHQAEIAKAILMDSEIESHLIDKKDSMYSFGEIELYVKIENEILAKLIITQNKL